VTAGPPPPDRALDGRWAVLVVEDEEMVRRLVARMLVLEGYRVLEARDGREALRVLQRAADRVRIVVTDLAMPGVNGRELATTVARCWPWVPVLFMSGYPAMRMVSEGALDPAAPFLQKPFTSDQLARKVRELLAAPPPQ
jgi:two-component system cell cycle sensor histidine kinase/response regulator CckA